MVEIDFPKETKMKRQKTPLLMAAGLFLLLIAIGILGPLYGQLQQSGGTGSSVTATQSGTWNINNISGTVSLPSGAATAAKQPALGTAGSASADVLTVQGIASMTALKVDGSAVTQPVSGTVSANASQTGTWTVQPGNTANTTAWLVKMAPVTACGSTAFTPAWQAVPTSNTALTATTSCVIAIMVSNTNASAQTVTVTDGQGSPVTVLNAFSIPANSQVTLPFHGAQMTSGIKWTAGGAGLTGTVVAYQ